MTGIGASAGDIIARDKCPRPGLRVSKKAAREYFSAAASAVAWEFLLGHRTRQAKGENLAIAKGRCFNLALEVSEWRTRRGRQGLGAAFSEGGSYRNDQEEERSCHRPPARPYDDPPTGYSSAGCSSAEPASAPPAECYFEGVPRPLSIRLEIRLTRHRGFKDGYQPLPKGHRL